MALPPQTNPPDSTRHDDVIEAIDFQPLRGPRTLRKRVLNPALVVICGLALVSTIIFWFLLTARSIVIHTDPEAARVRVDGMAFHLANHYLLRTGTYRVRADMPGYVPYDGLLTVTDDTDAQFNITLQKQPGHLVVTTAPVDAAITFAGTGRGTAPLQLRDIAPGTYPLVATAPRYSAAQTTVTVDGMDRTQHLILTLQPAWGYVQLTSSPAGAEIRVDGELRGITPARVEVLASGEDVVLSLAGHKPWRATLSVPVGKTHEQPLVTLLPADAVLSITTRPPGAGITIDGKYRGHTPLDAEVPPGREQSVQVFLDGYHPVQRKVTLASGQQSALALDLKPRLATLRIVADPDDAQLYIDGAARGRVGQTIELPARAHHIEARKAGYLSQHREVTPQPGLEQVVRFKLVTAVEARRAALDSQITAPGGQALKLFQPQQTFTTGASRREQGRRANEAQRNVVLQRPFYLGVREVTNSEFKKFAATHSSSHVQGTTLDTPKQPVVNVSWNDAARYCNWLSQQQELPLFYREKNGKIVGFTATSTGYRLPTETEWEWAARVAGDGTLRKFGWGNGFPPPSGAGNIADQSAGKLLGQIVANYNDGSASSAPVASFAANAKGLYDLDGNVAEWTHDFYGIAIVSASTEPEVDPPGPTSGEFHVIRGQSWRHSSITELRLAFRDYGVDSRDDVGFRIARYAQ